MRNYYDLGVHAAYMKFAGVAPPVRPVTPMDASAGRMAGIGNAIAAHAAPVPAAPAAQAPSPARGVSGPPRWEREEPTKPVVGSQPFTHADIMAQAAPNAAVLGPSVLSGLSQPPPQGAPGMPPPYRGRNSYASLQAHFI